MILDICNPDIIFLALNFSKDIKLKPFENFHANSIFKLRYALQNSIFYGGYMTDLYKIYKTISQRNKRNPSPHYQAMSDLSKSIIFDKLEAGEIISIASEILDLEVLKRLIG